MNKAETCACLLTEAYPACEQTLGMGGGAHVSRQWENQKKTPKSSDLLKLPSFTRLRHA